jgi:hypothetical protein
MRGEDVGRYVRMDPEPVFGQSEPPRPPMSPFLVQMLRQFVQNMIGTPLIIRSRKKEGYGGGLLGFGRGLRR